MTKANDGSDFDRMRRRRGRTMAKLNRKSSSEKPGVSINSAAGNAAKATSETKSGPSAFDTTILVLFLLFCVVMGLFVFPLLTGGIHW